MRGAIKGMMEALGDSHSSYLDPTHYESTTAQLEGEAYEGIGAWVDTRREYLTIISPIPGSPAEKAGLQPGDQIIGVDGEDMTGIAGEAVRQKVIGPEGTTVRLEVLREGQEPFEVVVERSSIKPPDLETRMLEGNIAYLRLINFSSSAAREMHLALEELLAQNPAGLILDLRNNGGGYLDTGISVVSEFIGDGVVMYEDFGEGERKTFEAETGGLATDIPLVVLINEGSASASEIVAGAIQARDRGLLVGETSYGKGSVQVFTPLVDEQGGVRITIARWLTPDGKTIHEVGLTPDEVVEMQIEDLEAGRDPQLDKGVELLKR
jgi:carboxyl-terminal processing protease